MTHTFKIPLTINLQPTCLISESEPDLLKVHSLGGGVSRVEYVEVFHCSANQQLHTLPLKATRKTRLHSEVDALEARQTSDSQCHGYTSHITIGSTVVKVQISEVGSSECTLTVACTFDLPDDFLQQGQHVIYKSDIKPLVTELYDSLQTTATVDKRREHYHRAGLMNVIKMFDLPEDTVLDAFLHRAPFKKALTIMNQKNGIVRHDSAVCSLTEKLQGLRKIYSTVATPGSHNFDMKLHHLYRN